MSLAFDYRYSGPTRGPQYDAWREEFCRKWIAADFESIADSHIGNRMRGTAHGPLTVCTTGGSASHMFGRRPLNGDSGDVVFLVLAANARHQVAWNGRAAELACGDLALMLPGATSKVTQLETGHRISLRVPRPIIAPLVRALEDRAGTRLTVAPALRGLLASQVAKLHREPSDGAEQPAEGRWTSVLDLMALVMGARPDFIPIAHRRGLAAARFEAMCDDIGRSARDSAFSITELGSRHGLSERSLQVLFERHGTTFTDQLREHRLLLAFQELTAPEHRMRKIGELALSVGFSDVSYFNRTFRARFGMTPGEVRERANAAAR